MSNALIDIALKYLQDRGWGTFPIRPKDKVPLIEWTPYQRQLPEEATIRAWFTKWPDANLGLPCGALSNLAVLDVDGEEGLRTLEERGYDIPGTLTVITGRGKHYYFLHPGKPTSNFVRGRSAISLPGVDFRGDGGYVVAPPSTHASGVLYRFIDEDCPIAPVPEWLYKLAIRTMSPPLVIMPGAKRAQLPQGNSLAERILDKAISMAHSGTRNDTGFELATQLRDNEVAEQEARPLMCRYAQVVRERGTHPYTEEEALASLRQAYSRSPRQPWGTRASLSPSDSVDPVSSGRPLVIPEVKWPILDERGYHGLLGRAVRLLEPHTEADPVALLVCLLAEVGTMLNRAPHLELDGSYHPLLFWPVLVGQSSKSRKGTTDKRCRSLLSIVDRDWTRGEQKGTLSSGEGLAYAVRDPEYKNEPIREKGKPTGEYTQVQVDPGVEDKRLFLVQSEFGSVLRIMAREGNSLSGVLRDAWDGQDLAPMTKSNRVRAAQPHIGIVGHVTKDELVRNLTETDASNGFGNRFVWLAVRRSKELPFPSCPDPDELASLAREFGRVITRARTHTHLQLAEPARDTWTAAYSRLSADRPGLAGSLLSRAEAQVMRLAGLYAVLDGTMLIEVAHLEAALGLWDFAEASTKLIFGDSLGDAVADTILRAFDVDPEMDDTRISSLFGRNVNAARLNQAKTMLAASGLIVGTTHETGGRRRTVWRRRHETNETN